MSFLRPWSVWDLLVSGLPFSASCQSLDRLEKDAGLLKPGRYVQTNKGERRSIAFTQSKCKDSSGLLYLAWQWQGEGCMCSLAHAFITNREPGEKVWGGERRGSVGNGGPMRAMWEDVWFIALWGELVDVLQKPKGNGALLVRWFCGLQKCLVLCVCIR